MAIDLHKGVRINIPKKDTVIQYGQQVILEDIAQFYVVIGWDIGEKCEDDLDIDISVFMLNDKQKIVSDDYFIFYNNVISPDGSVSISSDSKYGNNDENIKIDTNKINPNVREICFFATRYGDEARIANFSSIKNLYLYIYDYLTDEIVLKYEIIDNFTDEKSIEFGRIFQQNYNWFFLATGEGSNDGLQQLIDRYC